MKKILGTFLILLFIACSPEDINSEISSFSTSEIPQGKATQVSKRGASKPYMWVQSMQHSNGLMESAEQTNFVSLYDNALAVMLFTRKGEYSKAAMVLDHFNSILQSEFHANGGGFFQARSVTANTSRRLWMGDNAWLLLAIRYYRQQTGISTYDTMANDIDLWLRSLQREDGRLIGGTEEDGREIPAITEGMITAFYAVDGYDNFHKSLLDYLSVNRFDHQEQIFLTGSDVKRYDYALDLHSLGYLIFNELGVPVLQAADRYLTTQRPSKGGKAVEGYCFDIDQDVVWLEGTAQMTLAFQQAGEWGQAQHFMDEMNRSFISSSLRKGSSGLPYTTNEGTTFGAGYLWDHADKKPALSSTIWYLFAESDFNPLQFQGPKQVPPSDMFWVSPL